MKGGTSIGRVRGLGSAKEGAHHFWHQRLSAGSNLLLMLWLVFSLANLGSYGYDGVREWLTSAWVVVPMLLLVASVFYHARLGLQVVLEDYQKDETRIVLMILLNLVMVGGFALAAFSLLRIAFTGTAD